jgi:hypothetical protein
MSGLALSNTETHTQVTGSADVWLLKLGAAFPALHLLLPYFNTPPPISSNPIKTGSFIDCSAHSLP